MTLNKRLRGYYNYYCVIGNYDSLKKPTLCKTVEVRTPGYIVAVFGTTTGI